MNDTPYLNYPGLKYLHKDEGVDWSEDASSYLNYDGLKVLDGSGSSVDTAQKTFLNYYGLKYLINSKFAGLRSEEE